MRACNEKSNAEAEERQINGGDIAWSDVALHVIKSGCVVYEVFVIGVGLWLCFQCFQCFQCSLCFLLLKHLPARTTWLPFEICDRYCQNGILIIFIAWNSQHKVFPWKCNGFFHHFSLLFRHSCLGVCCFLFFHSVLLHICPSLGLKMAFSF